MKENSNIQQRHCKELKMHFFYKCCSKECNKHTDIHAIAKNIIATKLDRDKVGIWSCTQI